MSNKHIHLDPVHSIVGASDVWPAKMRMKCNGKGDARDVVHDGYAGKKSNIRIIAISLAAEYDTGKTIHNKISDWVVRKETHRRHLLDKCTHDYKLEFPGGHISVDVGCPILFSRVNKIIRGRGCGELIPTMRGLAKPSI